MNQHIPNESSSKWYLHHLDTHISTSKQQILGQGSILVPNKRTPHSTIVPPSNAIWTPEEKSIFFASLRRHSRFRPDEIAAEVGSKTEAEVEWYLDLLELGDELSGQVDRRRHHEGLKKLRWDGLRSWRKGLSPASREVSETWISKEEDLSGNVIRHLGERENEEKQILTRKHRREERRLLSQNFNDCNEDATPYLRNKLMESHPSFKAMENKWAIEEYLESLDGDKLNSLNGLMKPDWSTWYSDRVRNPSPQKGSLKDKEEDHLLGDEGEPREEKVEGTPTKGDPQGRIAIDQKNYDDLIIIPKKERTTAQRKLLSAITNRRRNREKYRISKLVEEGLSIDEIDLAGGADAIFASREENPIITQQQQQRRASPTKKVDSGLIVGKLRNMGMYDHLMMSGIEVFNFDMIQKVNRRLDLDEPRNTSFAVLQGIHALLVKYLRQLIYNALVIAEQAYIQKPDDDESLPELHADHVHQALSAAGLVHPSEMILEFIERMFDNEDDAEELLDHDEGNEEPAEGPVNEGTADEGIPIRIPRYRSDVYPPGDISWNHIPLLSSNEMDTSTDVADGGGGGGGGGITGDDLSDAATEIEDEELDQALDEMDEAHDKIYEDSLWKALQKDEVYWEENDRAEIWTSGTGSGNGSKGPVNKAEKEYVNLLLSIDSERRKRKHKDYIYRRYPTTRIKKLARANKRMKSNAWIIDSGSDSETDSDDGYAWNGGDDTGDSDIGESEDGDDAEIEEDGDEVDSEGEGHEGDEMDELEVEDGKEDQDEEDELGDEDEKGDEEEDE